MAQIFSDGFESGNLTAWSSATTDGGNLSAATGAKLHGNYGLSALINDNNALYVEDDTPNNETRYRARFYINVNSLTIQQYQNVYVLLGFRNDFNDTLQIILSDYSTNKTQYKIIPIYYDDTGAAQGFGNPVAISNGIHCIEFDWKCSSGIGANDGTYKVWIDGSLVIDLSGLDNDTKRLGTIQFGATLPSGTFSGTLYLDDFASNNDGGEIGLIDTATLTGTVTSSITEADIVAGGKTIILTITGDTWVVAAGGLFDAQRQNIINGLTSAQSETHGWNNEVKAKIAVTDVVRTSDTVATITLDVEAGYDITSTETITATVPATALLFTAANVVASPTFNITATAPTLSIGGKTLLGVGV